MAIFLATECSITCHNIHFYCASTCYIQHSNMVFSSKSRSDPHLLVNCDRVHLESSNWTKTSPLTPLPQGLDVDCSEGCKYVTYQLKSCAPGRKTTISKPMIFKVLISPAPRINHSYEYSTRINFFSLRRTFTYFIVNLLFNFVTNHNIFDSCCGVLTQQAPRYQHANYSKLSATASILYMYHNL